jgi:hypothetical protein
MGDEPINLAVDVFDDHLSFKLLLMISRRQQKLHQLRDVPVFSMLGADAAMCELRFFDDDDIYVIMLQMTYA